MGDDGILARRLAYEAETYLTLKRIAQVEDLSIELGSDPEKIIACFPQGLGSLPREFHYSPAKLLSCPVESTLIPVVPERGLYLQNFAYLN